MAIIVNTNLSAIKTQNNLNSATNTLNSALERMSTGYKINSAKDDAAGMFIATGLTSQISGSKIAQTNVATGTNVLQTLEGSLDAILDNYERIRDLAVQASNGVYDKESLDAMTSEVTARLAEVTRIQAAANFNGLALLTESTAGLGSTGLRLQVGANADAAANAITVDKTVFQKLTAPAVDLSTAEKAAASIDKIDESITDIATRKSAIGAAENRLSSANASLTTTIENATAAKSTIMDADIAEESAEYTKARILQQTSASLLVQANALPSLALTLVTS